MKFRWTFSPVNPNKVAQDKIKKYRELCVLHMLHLVIFRTCTIDR